MLRGLFVVLALGVVAAPAAAAADDWVAACDERMHDAKLVYQSSVDDFPRWDFAEWQWATSTSAVQLHYTWRDYDYRVAVSATSEPRHAWRARWVRGAWWLERVDHGRLASVRAA